MTATAAGNDSASTHSAPLRALPGALAAVLSRGGLALASLLVAGLLLAVGCTQRARIDEFEALETRDEQDHFARAIDILFAADEYRPQTAGRRAIDHLNVWMQEQQPDSRWFADPLLARLPAELANAPGADDLSRLRLHEGDFESLREAVWMQQASSAILARRRSDTPSAAGGDGSPAGQLQTALWLFDWTVRNIQLDPLVEPVKQTAGPLPANAPTAVNRPAVAGPGERYTPWQCLLVGHGDAWLRSRVFLQLARQQDIPVVLLEVKPAGGGKGTPWVAAALIEDSLYLFDPALGLPIPGPGDAPVATFEQAREDPALLQSLDLDASHPYPVTSAQLQQVTALIDASPDNLAQRMRLIEQRLAGERKVKLTVDASGLAKRLRTLPGIGEVRLWTVPYQAVQYRYALARDAEAMKQFAREFFVFEESPPMIIARLIHYRHELEAAGENRAQIAKYFQPGMLPALLRARLLHIYGKYDDRAVRPDPDDPYFETQTGAKGYYLQCRVADSAIATVDTTPEYAEFFKEVPDDPATRAAVVGQVKELMTLSKQHASYWLGLIATDQRQWGIAADYFKTRVLDASPKGPWTAGATYNLARCYEALGRPDDAIRLYESDTSPQAHGNKLRARRLKAK